MKYKLFKRFFTACILVLVICCTLMIVVLNHFLEKRNLAELEDRALYISTLVNSEGKELLENMGTESGIRTTLVAADGTVLFDSMLEPSEMGDHGDREEIQEALMNGTGESQRYSESMLNKTANYAVLLNDGTVLRISMTEDTIFRLFLSLLNPMLIAMMLTVLLSLMLANQFTNDIMRPINQLDVENPDDRDLYEEMKPFVHRIVAQNQQIYHQMNELREENKKQDILRREFTANVSHELKTPLTSISGFAEIIRDGFVKQEDIPHFADNIYQEAQRLIVLVNDILKLSKMEDGTVKLQDEKTKVDMLELCQRVTKRLTLNAEKNTVTMECTGETAEMMGVSGILEEIVYNICDNAIKYNQPGGFVNIAVQRRGEEVMVSVADNGIGIPKEEQERIFERFYRVNKSHSKEVGGTGLGLSIVKHGLLLHNGRMELESEVGEGTKISMWFPVTE